MSGILEDLTAPKPITFRDLTSDCPIFEPINATL
jgi:hypothetical protein